MTYHRFLITRDGERFFTWQLSDLEGFRPNKRFLEGCVHICNMYIRIYIMYVIRIVHLYICRLFLPEKPR